MLLHLLSPFIKHLESMNTKGAKFPIVVDVINSNPEENRRSDKLMARLQKDFGPEITLGKSETMEERRIRWATYQN
jgi:hypothetical protein